MTFGFSQSVPVSALGAQLSWGALDKDFDMSLGCRSKDNTSLTCRLKTDPP